MLFSQLLHYQRLFQRREGRAGVSDIKQGGEKGTEIHGAVTSVINRCFGSSLIYYAVLLVALPPDTQQNEISSQQTPCI